MKKGTIELKSERLTLRKYILEDIKTLHEELGCRPEMMKYTGWNPYYPIEAAEGFITGIIKGYELQEQFLEGVGCGSSVRSIEGVGCGSSVRSIEDSDCENPGKSVERIACADSGENVEFDNEIKEYSWIIEAAGKSVGIIGAYDFDAEQNCIEIGYSIFRESWGKGFAFEALAMVCEYLMSEEGINSLKAWSATENRASQKVLLKAGFEMTGVKESAINVNGEKFDQAFYEKKQ